VTSSVVLAVATMVTLTAAVAAIVTLIRCWPPTLDRATSRTVTRALNRGTLPGGEPQRGLAVRTAHSRAANAWLALLALGSAVLMVRSAYEWSDAVLTPLSWAAAAVAVVGAAINAFVAVQARRALASD
jgi:hypothetical protein